MAWRELDGTHVSGLERVNDLVVLDGRGWAITSRGHLLRWSGASPVTSIAVGNYHGRCIGMAPGGKVGWIGLLNHPADPQRLLKTTDGGDSWTPVVTPLPADPAAGLCGIEVLDEQTAFACGTYKNSQRPGMWQTLNGHDWTAIQLPASADATSLTDLAFAGVLRPLVAGGAGSGASERPLVLYRDDDGSWKPSQIVGAPARPSRCWKLFFLEDGVTGYASLDRTTDDGWYLKTRDAGKSWQALPLRQHTRQDWDLQGIGFLDAQTGWVCSRLQEAYVTRDGGKSWNPSQPLRGINRFVRTPAGWYACGDAIYLGP